MTVTWLGGEGEGGLTMHPKGGDCPMNRDHLHRVTVLGMMTVQRWS